MLLDSYATELEIVRAMNNERTFIINFSHKLQNDKNITEFLKNLSVNAVDYENLEFMKAFDFDRELEATFRVMSAFEQLLLNSNLLEGKSGNEIAVPCRTFPDYVGQRILYLIGHIPLLEATHLKLQYKNLKKMKLSAESEELYKSRTHEKLFNRESFIYRTFPDSKTYKDRNLINQKVDFELDEYESALKNEISEKIKYLASSINDFDDKRNAYQQIGITYWDHRKEQQTDQKNALQSTITEVIKALAEDK